MSCSGGSVSKNFCKLKLFLESLGIKHNRNKLHTEKRGDNYLQNIKNKWIFRKVGRKRIGVFHGNHRLTYRLN